MFSRKVKRARIGNEIASCRGVSSDSHQRTRRGGSRGGRLIAAWLLLLAVALPLACDPITGTGSGTPPDPRRYLQVDAAARSAIVVLIAGHPATDIQFNYDGYGNGTLRLSVPAGWQVTVQCANHGTVPNSCAVVADATATEPLRPGWSTPDPRKGLAPGDSATFVFTPTTPGDYRIASLVPGSEASGMWLELRVVEGGSPTLTAQGA
jgi:Sulfocyanin (SoxE) domain